MNLPQQNSPRGSESGTWRGRAQLLPQQTHRGRVGAGCSSRAELRRGSVQAGKGPVCPVSHARQSRNIFFFVAISKTQPAPAVLAAAFEPQLPALAPSLVGAGDSPAAKLVASLISCDRSVSALPVPAAEHPDVWRSEPLRMHPVQPLPGCCCFYLLRCLSFPKPIHQTNQIESEER